MVSFQQLPLGFRFKMVELGFVTIDNLQQEALASIVVCRKRSVLIAVLIFLCVCLTAFVAPNEHRPCRSQAHQLLSWHCLHQYIGQSIINFFVMWQLLCISSSTWQMLWGITSVHLHWLQVVIKCCCSCFSIFVLLTHCWTVLTSTFASPYTLSKGSWMEVSFSLSATQNSSTHCLFQLHVIPCYLRISSGAGICRAKQSQQIEYEQECSRTSLM
jgi:hypothetical protein